MQKSRTPLRILILGGTGLIGPHYVRAAVARGHSVAVFNRGKSAADLPETVEPLRGDRSSDLTAIQGREWDAVLDLAAFVPAWVRSIGEALKDRVGHYTFISTILVYDLSKAAGVVSEEHPVKVYRGTVDPYSPSATHDIRTYGPFKVLCEQEAQRQFDGRALILRPGYIVGPGDPQGYFNYWPARMAAGGEILAAGVPSVETQYIDVRDLAEWNIRMIEQRTTGVYNAVGPTRETNLEEVLSVARDVTATAPKLTWVSAEWLAEQDRTLWQKVLFWSGLERQVFGSMQMDIRKAISAGFTSRPAKVTVADAYEWYRKQPASDPIRQIVNFKIHPDGPASMLPPMSWDAYLDEEKAVLSAWHAARP